MKGPVLAVFRIPKQQPTKQQAIYISIEVNNVTSLQIYHIAFSY